MDAKRYNELNSSENAALTDEEFEEGWHWCPDFDGLLIGGAMKELEACHCLIRPLCVYAYEYAEEAPTQTCISLFEDTTTVVAYMDEDRAHLADLLAKAPYMFKLLSRIYAEGKLTDQVKNLIERLYNALYT